MHSENDTDAPAGATPGDPVITRDPQRKALTADAAPPPWETCGAIAARWERVTSMHVHKMASILGLLDSKRHRRLVNLVAEYSPAAAGRIERELRSRGYNRASLDREAPP
jgi:hypothetical protein